jgi:Asp-tRNA(Asn)/Glu-tRNA(Gln) amidotransferase A subunit family amidase
VLPPLYSAIANAADASAWRVIARLAHTTQPSSYLGQPALAVPFALAPSGLPVGMQLIGRPHEEDTLFAAAAPLERHWQSLGAIPPFAP